MFKFNLRKKILISYILLLIILTFISFQAIRSLMQLSSITEQVIKENYESIFAAQSILKILERHQISQWMLIAGKNEAAKQILNENREEFFKWLDDAKANASLQGEAELVKKIEYFYIEYLAHYNWLEKSLQEKNTANIELYTKTARWQLDKLRQHTLSLIEMNRKAMLNSIQQSKKISENYISTVIIISGLGIFVGVGVSLLLTHIIVRPVENLTTAVSEVRKGNLDVSVETEYSDEIGILATEFNKMIKRLREYQTLNLEKLIEEKKRTEAVLRSVGDCMIVIDPHYKIIMVNPTAERVFYLIPGISHGRDFRDIFKSEALFNIVEDTIEKQNFTPKFTYPTFEWNYDRMTKHFQVKVFPVEKEDGARIAYIILLEDVTKLKELDQMKSDFISIASHELRTPLTSILMSIAMVLEGSAGPLTPDQKELLAAANEDGVRMRYMMNNLLDISRIETGRMEMEFFPVSPDSLLISVVNSFNAQAQAKKIELVADIEKELPNVYADYNRIMQVLNNLVSNALRYTPEGGKITLGAARGEDGLIEFRVEDTGSGIPRDYLKKVFRKFVQVESDPKRGGAGLGLALSLEIIRAHHGTLWVESELGKGSQFYFTLPVAKEENGEDEIAI